MRTILGRLVDEQTRCIHYHSELDVIAIKFKCCGRYYACFLCHQEIEGHEPVRWAEEEFGERVVLCGACKAELAIRDYLSSRFACPSCRSPFNPGCAAHYHLYFEMASERAGHELN